MVLRPLWRDAPLSVREVHDRIAETTGWAYTTTKTVMDRMVAKGLCRRDSRDGAYIYRPLITKPAGLARMVRFFADRVLEVDELSVVAMFKGSGSLTADEVEELARLVTAEEEEEKA